MPKELIEDNSCRVKALYVFYFLFLFAAEISVRYAFHNLPSNVSAAEYFRGVGNRAKYCNTIAKNKILFLWYGHGANGATARAPASKRADYSQPQSQRMFSLGTVVFGRLRVTRVTTSGHDSSVWCGMFVVEVRLRNVVCLCLLKVARKRTCVIATTMQGRS